MFRQKRPRLGPQGDIDGKRNRQQQTGEQKGAVDPFGVVLLLGEGLQSLSVIEGSSRFRCNNIR